MKTSPHSTLSGLALVLCLSACDNNAVPTDPRSSLDAGHRQISATLLATCPAFPANSSSRILRTSSDTSSPVIQVQTSPLDSLSYRIYDTTGSFVAMGTSLVLVSHADSAAPNPKPPGLLWDTKDTTGNPVPSGHYLLFEVVKDSTGAVVQEDSSCIGVFRPTSN